MAGPFIPTQSPSMPPIGISSHSFFPNILCAILNRSKCMVGPGETCYWMFLEVQKALLQSCALCSVAPARCGCSPVEVKGLYWFLGNGPACHFKYAGYVELWPLRRSVHLIFKLRTAELPVNSLTANFAMSIWLRARVPDWHFLCRWLGGSRAILVTIQHLSFAKKKKKKLSIYRPHCSNVFISIY